MAYADQLMRGNITVSKDSKETEELGTRRYASVDKPPTIQQFGALQPKKRMTSKDNAKNRSRSNKSSEPY